MQSFDHDVPARSELVQALLPRSARPAHGQERLTVRVLVPRSSA